MWQWCSIWIELAVIGQLAGDDDNDGDTDIDETCGLWRVLTADAVYALTDWLEGTPAVEHCRFALVVKL